MSDGGFLEEAKNSVAFGGGLGGVLLFGRWALNFIAGRYDKRQAQLDAEHAALDMSWKDYRKLLEQRAAQLDSRIDALERQVRAAYSSWQHVSVGLMKHDPQAPELVIAERLMAAAFPTDFTMAAQMAGAALDRESKG